ncbi:MAG TPA: ATP-binding protein, partial [Microcoleus sp.]|nr:ATP-binding protein [Microcoleus sp.]
MTQIFGDFIEQPASQEYLIMGFSPSSVPLKQRWRNNGLSADFLADYLTTFFPGNQDDPSTIERQAEIKSAVS